MPDACSASLYARIAEFGHKEFKIIRSKHPGDDCKSLIVDSAQPTQIFLRRGLHAFAFLHKSQKLRAAVILE
jgi:hypothetical protein